MAERIRGLDEVFVSKQFVNVKYKSEVHNKQHNNHMDLTDHIFLNRFVPELYIRWLRTIKHKTQKYKPECGK